MIQKVEIINKNEFAVVSFNEDNKPFVVAYGSHYARTNSNIHLFIENLDCFARCQKDCHFPPKYANHINVCSPDFAAELLKHTGIDNCIINLLNNKQQTYDLPSYLSALRYCLSAKKMVVLTVHLRF